MDIEVTGIRILLQLNNNEQWADATDSLSDDLVELLERFADAVELTINSDPESNKHIADVLAGYVPRKTVQ